MKPISNYKQYCTVDTLGDFHYIFKVHEKSDRPIRFKMLAFNRITNKYTIVQSFRTETGADGSGSFIMTLGNTK